MVAKRSFLFKGIFSSAAAFALVTFLNECLAWAHGDEVHAGAPKAAAPWWVWAGGLCVLTAVAILVVRIGMRRSRSGEFEGFSRKSQVGRGLPKPSIARRNS